MVSRRKTKKSRCLTGGNCISSLGLFTSLVLFPLIVGSFSLAWAETTNADQTKTDGTAQQDEVKKILNLDDLLRSDFVYRRKNRPDPFVPFISEQTQPDQLKTEEEILTGMRLFEPGQLNLVAITTGDLGPLALVQDSTGKGYILKEGIGIGRRGIVKSIIPNIVIIEEIFLSSAGQKKTRAIEMVLRTEGEK